MKSQVVELDPSINELGRHVRPSHLQSLVSPKSNANQTAGITKL